MPHVSKNSIHPQTLMELQEELMETICSSTGSFNRKRFLRELLTGTEQIMLAKRLAIIYLLEKGMSSHQIWKMLKVSPSTVARIDSKLETKYKYIDKFVKQKQLEKPIIKILEKILFVLPSKTSSFNQVLDDL